MGFWSNLFGGKKEEENTEKVAETPQETTEESTPEVETPQEGQAQ